jgi:hypothetical protein
VKARGLADGVAADVLAVIESVGQIHEADGIDVEVGLGVARRAHGLAGDEQQVVDPRGAGAQQVGTHLGHPAATAGVLDHRLDALRRPAELGEDEGWHARLAAGLLGKRDEVDTGSRQPTHLLEYRSGDPAAGERQLDAGDESAAGKLAGDAGLLLERNRLRRRRPVHVAGHRRGGGGGLGVRDSLAQGSNVVRGGAAASSQQARPLAHGAPRPGDDVVGCREIEIAPLHGVGLAGVGLARERHVHRAAHRLERVQGRERLAAVHAHGIRARLGQARGGCAGVHALHGHAALAHRDLRDDRQVMLFADGPDRLFDLGQVRKGLHDEEIHARPGECPGLLLEDLARLLAGNRTEGLDVHAERTDRSRHPGFLARRLARQLRAAHVDLLHLLGQPARRELEAVGGEGVGLQDVCAGRDVGLVDLAHQRGVGEIELLEGAVDEHPLRVEHGPHGPVEERNPTARQQVGKGLGSRRGGHEALHPAVRVVLSSRAGVRAAPRSLTVILGRSR